MGVQYLGDSGPDGTSVGKATTEKVSFYGVTPVVQRSGGAQAWVSTTAVTWVSTTAASVVTSTAFSTVWGFASSSQANSIITSLDALITQSASNTVLVNELRAALVALGAIAGA